MTRDLAETIREALCVIFGGTGIIGSIVGMLVISGGHW